MTLYQLGYFHALEIWLWKFERGTGNDLFAFHAKKGRAVGIKGFFLVVTGRKCDVLRVKLWEVEWSAEHYFSNNYIRLLTFVKNAIIRKWEV